MNYFVLVFGDPKHGDEVENGQYEADKRYPAFEVQLGDMLLVYCTEGYKKYPKQFPGIGVALNCEAALVKYRWISFAAPIKRELIEQTFEPDDRTKMRELGITTRRAFKISPISFAKTIANQPLGSVP